MSEWDGRIARYGDGMRRADEDTGPIRAVGTQAASVPKFGNGTKALALVLIAVLSGVLWWLLNRDGGGSNETTPAAGQSSTPPSQTQSPKRFQRVGGPVNNQDCRKQSYGTAKKYFKKHNCQRLHQVLYSRKTERGEVLSSVSTVTMPDSKQAKELKAVTDADGAGNVTDLVTAGVRLPGGTDTLKGGGYASTQRGSKVIIVESGFFDGRPYDDAFLSKISQEALDEG